MLKKLNNSQFIELQKTKNNPIFNDWHKKDNYISINKKIFKNAKAINLLLGTPNVGKSSCFNKLTTATANVSNIDRMTVDNAVGKLKYDKNHLLVDLPGIYNLSHAMDEELVVAHEIYHEQYDHITNIIGAQSIERDLLLTIQTIETGLMNTLIINMIDEVNYQLLDINKLSKLLNNVHIVLTQFNTNRGIETSSKSIINSHNVNSKIITYDNLTEKCINKISKLLPNDRKISKRFYAIMLLENNAYTHEFIQKYYPKHFHKIKKILNKYKNINFADILTNQRKHFIKEILRKTIKNNSKLKVTFFSKKNKTKQQKFDKKILNKWIGIPLMLLLLIFVYYLSFGNYTGGKLQELIQVNFTQKLLINKGLRPLFWNIFHAADSPIGIWFANFFIDGAISGFFSVLSFIPPLIILFTLINIIHQTGLIARLSVLLDASFEKFGLSGRSILNLFTGFGCNVPAVMLARSSNSKKEKFISIIIAPFISCSARIIACSFILNALSPTYGWMGLIGCLLLSSFIALFVGLFFSKILFRKQKSFFIVEFVDWRKPDFVVICKNVWVEIKDFFKKVTTKIIIATMIIWLFLHVSVNFIIIDVSPKNYEWNHTDISFSLLGYTAKGINYIMYPLGLDNHGWVKSENGWKMTLSLLSGLLAKETVISNAFVIFGNADNFSTFLQNFPSITLSYLVIFMFYIPCIATISMMRKEGGFKILLMHLASAWIISYSLGIIFYWITFVINRI